MPTPTELSVVIPMYNEEEALPALAERLRPALDELGVTYEVVAVDDGSHDETPQHLLAMRRTWPQLRVIRLRRNAGHQAALTAGLHRSVGAYVVSIDADLQDPPEKIADMLRLARDENLDIVYGVRSDRTTDSFFKRTTAGIYYAIMQKLVGSWMPRHAGDFRLLRRPVVDALKALPERQPVYRMLVPSLGFASGEVTYVREERVAGKTKYPDRQDGAARHRQHHQLLGGTAAPGHLPGRHRVLRVPGAARLRAGRLARRLDRAGLDVPVPRRFTARRRPARLPRPAR
ncbi:glycosyltransferase family 2 protein [Luedemannella flava]